MVGLFGGMRKIYEMDALVDGRYGGRTPEICSYADGFMIKMFIIVISLQVRFHVQFVVGAEMEDWLFALPW